MKSAICRTAAACSVFIGIFSAGPACGSGPDSSALPSALIGDRPVERFEYDSGKQLEKLVNDLGYTPEAWQAGIRVVPRIYLTNVPERWRQKTSKEVTVLAKKRVFFRLLGPLVLRSNELIQADRDRAQGIIAKLRKGAGTTPADTMFLRETAAAYKVSEGDAVLSDRALQDELLIRLDTIPPSLVLAQAAEESGWGTSRFADEGNALFGQWTWGGEGITPLEQRSQLGNYKIAAYETPLQSIIAYMHNLNTHPAYAALRARRGDRVGAREHADELLRARPGVCRLPALPDAGQQAHADRRRLPRRRTDDPLGPNRRGRQMSGYTVPSSTDG